MYYACFYVVSAYVVKTNSKVSTHSGLKAIFNKELVKTGKVEQENGKLFNQLFGLRQEADYEDFSPIEKEDIETLIP